MARGKADVQSKFEIWVNVWVPMLLRDSELVECEEMFAQFNIPVNHLTLFTIP